MSRSGSPNVWIHCADQKAAEVASALVERFDAVDLDARPLFTGGADLRDARPNDFAPLPTDTPTACRKFLDEANPAVLCWIGGGLRPGLMASIGRTKLPAVWANCAGADVAPRRLPWPGRGSAGMVEPFQRVFVTDGLARTRLVRLGIEESRIRVTGPILPDINPPTFDPNEMTVWAEQIGSRPVWLTLGALPGELGQLVAAHKAASTRGHRLLMLVHPKESRDGESYQARLADLGMRTALFSRGDHINEDVQAFVIDREDSLGMWLRLSPLTFMGGSLSGPSGASPLAPAALGSVVLTGPFQKPWMDHYDRLSNAEACKRVRSGRELGVALGELMAPDRSATMAHAAWEELTRSSDTLNQLADMMAEAASGRGVN